MRIKTNIKGDVRSKQLQAELAALKDRAEKAEEDSKRHLKNFIDHDLALSNKDRQLATANATIAKMREMLEDTLLYTVNYDKQKQAEALIKKGE